MKPRIYNKTTVQEIKDCADRGMSVQQIAQELHVSPQALAQAFSLLEELHSNGRGYCRLNRQTARANNPFGLCG